MNISLINYKIFTGKYIIYEQNGKGKEIDYNGHIRYEGEYLNGERNGKGKEYDDYEGELLFEGEYLHNERLKGKIYDQNCNIIHELNKDNDIVKEYDDKGDLIFEGKYLKGLKNGKGKEYFRNNQLIFEGEYLNGLRNGKGKEYFNVKLKFEGEYLNGKRNGKGKEYNIAGNLKFEKIYFNNRKWEGKWYDMII